MSERYLTTREFAEIIGVPRSTVISWIKSGRIVAYSVNGRWRIPHTEVERLLKGVQRIRRIAISPLGSTVRGLRGIESGEVYWRSI